jgi:RNA polymerase sigma-70 factor, ECF subfamily
MRGESTGLSASSTSALIALCLKGDEAAWDALVYDTDPDAALVARCLSGNEKAWETLIRHHTRRVFSICYRFTGNSSEAEELTQEVFLRVFRTLQHYRSDKGAFLPWMMRLTRNLLLDHYRRKKASGDNPPIAEAETSKSPIAAETASKVLQSALDQLPPNLREVVVLRDLEELEYSEIATILNISVPTLHNRLRVARRSLARSLRSLMNQEASEAAESKESVAQVGSAGRSFTDIVPTIAHAVAVFGDEHKASHWLSTPLPFLDNLSPSQALESEGGTELVEQILTRIEHNIPS